MVRDQVKEGRQPAETVARAIEIGARVIESEGTAANVDFVNSQFERHLGKLGVDLAEKLESGSEELAEQIAATFGADRSDSVQQQIRDLLFRATEHQRNELVKVFNAEDGTNPLSDFKTAVTSKVAEAAQRGERQAEALREARTRSPRSSASKSPSFVPRSPASPSGARARSSSPRLRRRGRARAAASRTGCTTCSSSIASARGDVAHHVGDVQAETRGKKGDTVAEVGAAYRPGARPRSCSSPRTSGLSRPKAWEVLNGALEDRGADYAVLVVAGEDNLPATTQSLTEYEGNKLIVAVDRDEPERRRPRGRLHPRSRPGAVVSTRTSSRSTRAQ